VYDLQNVIWANLEILSIRSVFNGHDKLAKSGGIVKNDDKGLTLLCDLVSEHHQALIATV
jgi:hypothetical protein